MPRRMGALPKNSNRQKEDCKSVATMFDIRDSLLRINFCSPSCFETSVRKLVSCLHARL